MSVMGRFKIMSEFAQAADILYRHGTATEAEAEVIAKGGTLKRALTEGPGGYCPVFHLCGHDGSYIRKFVWKGDAMDPGIASLGKEFVDWATTKPGYNSATIMKVFDKPYTVVCCQRTEADIEVQVFAPATGKPKEETVVTTITEGTAIITTPVVEEPKPEPPKVEGPKTAGPRKRKAAEPVAEAKPTTPANPIEAPIEGDIPY